MAEALTGMRMGPFWFDVSKEQAFIYIKALRFLACLLKVQELIS